MRDVRIGKFVLGVAVVAAIGFASDVLLHQKVVNADWHAVYAALGAAPRPHGGWNAAYFALYELARGALTMLLFVLLRPRLGIGAGTAALAGLVTWSVFSVAAPAQWIPIGFYSHALWIKSALFQLVFSVVAAVAGAALTRTRRTLH